MAQQHFSDLEFRGLAFLYEQRYGRPLRKADFDRFQRGETSRVMTRRIIEVFHEHGLIYRLRGYYFGRGFGPSRLGEPDA